MTPFAPGGLKLILEVGVDLSSQGLGDGFDCNIRWAYDKLNQLVECALGDVLILFEVAGVAANAFANSVYFHCAVAVICVGTAGFESVRERLAG